ncbi:hypothetical protein COCNU_09G007890 [Cocos nucifera]|uniref:RING-type E3 ubiquitin transferase n=1 Tax=Cocos nucifera TaxID=13894 RepID=A0A8K0IKW0_COCNU|nr:hypothetical protein COCNU_09G007890 [Cocos nucifera]
MALVSSSVPVFLPQQQQMESRRYGRTASVKSSGSSRSTVLTEIEEKPAVEEAAVEEEDKVYVAVGKEVKEGKANLLWVLENISRGEKIVIVHIHRPAQKIPMMGAWFPVNQLKESEVKAYWQLEREKMNKCLDEYIVICARFKVRAEKLVIETEDIGKGIVDLIAQQVITKLVMGAAADKYYSRFGGYILPLNHILAFENDDVGMDDDLYEKLRHALMEAESLKDEADEESRKRRKAERDLHEAARKTFKWRLKRKISGKQSFHSIPSSHHTISLVQVKEAESSYTKEMKLRKETEERVAGERRELEKLRKQRDDVVEELQNLCQQKMELALQLADSGCIFKDFEGKLSEARHLLNSLRLEHEKLRRERDDAVREAKERNQKKVEVTDGTHGTASFSEFSIVELKQATMDFDDSLKIGEGGYGNVYKGFLRHTTVAIKLLNPQSTQGRSEFHQEVDVLSRVRHPHLVTLIGACPEVWALIYEFLPNGSLEDRLACRNNTPPLCWQTRTRIASEIRSALIFLHSNRPQSVVHGDLKPANILLDANFTSKLGDFGICRFLVQSNTSTEPSIHTNPKGTFAYMDPEFLTSGELTPQSDVYSFGVIILRLLTGKPAFGIISKAKQLAQLGLKCCEVKRKRRPHLAGEAWRVLEPTLKPASSCLPSWLKASEDDNCIPSYFICPISQDYICIINKQPSALICLHSSKPDAIVHAGIKFANILLNANDINLIGDFGTARLIHNDLPQVATICHETNPMRKFGHTDPVFHNTEQLIPESDVNSFRIMVEHY